jgi:hypothetical protein
MGSTREDGSPTHSHSDGNPEVWVVDLQRKVANRRTFEAGEDIPSGITKWSRHCRARFGTDQICEYVAGRRKTVVMFDTISGSV